MNAGDEYRCRTCGGRFRRPKVPVSCCVIHLPAECCHYGDERLSEGDPNPRGSRASAWWRFRVACVDLGDAMVRAARRE